MTIHLLKTRGRRAIERITVFRQLRPRGFCSLFCQPVWRACVHFYPFALKKVFLACQHTSPNISAVVQNLSRGMKTVTRCNPLRLVDRLIKQKRRLLCVCVLGGGVSAYKKNLCVCVGGGTFHSLSRSLSLPSLRIWHYMLLAFDAICRLCRLQWVQVVFSVLSFHSVSDNNLFHFLSCCRKDTRFMTGRW